MSRNGIEGKVVLITGGAKNLGGLLAREFARQGAKAVAIHYNSDETQAAAEETIAAVRATGAEAVAFQADLTKAAAMEKLFNDVVASVGRPDIAINTVGMVVKQPIMEVTEAVFDQSCAVNVKTAFFFLKEAGKHVNDNGKICTIVTSLLGAYTPFYAAYEGLKAPVEHFTRSASKEFGARGISVTAIGPGPMDTPFFYPAEEKEAVEYHKTAAALSPFSKTGLTDIEDIAPWIVFMVSDGWWMTGQTILVNGGYTTK
ncbi:SDR family oxidoreductase [Photobacterium halotolerans]|uniref:SDR family oxidoreductase n=1 Tax=Photobacterium halotolerans TaxID=265726 RepID=A0A7X4Y0V8_9GAMM|nr:SDR family oxidoreductase [Photobacterium halotolerans]NAW66602.1 SDR family oxidoreductase [Photobacterium halotolerans]NAW87274.1 SDR family oxidoreductase [Photobacterium halotolerans]NAX48868.1 SDR family oxidoreductase [Photobacterium halotolerans]